MKRCLALLFASLLGLIWLQPSVRSGEGAPNTLTEQEKKDGWKLLFDGTSLNGWRAYKKKDTAGWVARNGMIVLEKGGGDLLTEEQYANFEFSADFRFIKGNNSGIIYRVSEKEGGTTWTTGPECQVMPHNPKDKLGKNSGGSLYDMFAPTSNPFKGVDAWNTLKVVVNGKHIEHWVNGVKVVDTDIGSAEWNKAIEKSKWKNSKLFASQAKGHIALQDHGGSVAFRNVKIRVLPDTANKK